MSDGLSALRGHQELGLGEQAAAAGGAERSAVASLAPASLLPLSAGLDGVYGRAAPTAPLLGCGLGSGGGATAPGRQLGDLR